MDINNIDIRNGFKLVEASAGTGKSFTITHIVLRNIVEKELKPEEILILSFTKNTCTELKHKIIERIYNLEDYLKSNNKKNLDLTLINWIEKYIDYNPNKEEKVLKHIENFIENINELTVTTFHGLCNKLLNEYSIELESLQGYKIQNNIDDIYKEVINELWIEDFLNLDYELISSIKDKKISSKYKKINKINKQFFLRMLKDIDQENIYQFIPHKNISSDNLSLLINGYVLKSWNEFCNSWKDYGNKLYISLVKMGRNIKDRGLNSKIYSASPRDKFAIVNDWIDRINEKIKEKNFKNLIYEITKDDLLTNYFYNKSINKECRRLKIENNSDLFIELQENIYKIKDGIFNEIIRILISKAYYKLSLVKENKCILNYSDLIKIIQKSFLDEDNMNKKNINQISKKLKSILIDEFQDTDQIQWDIIKKLFNPNYHFLLCVGDPKQAIYKFRGGDLQTYSNAKKEASEIYTLSTNYRSNSELLEIINQIYKNGLAESKLRYEKLNAIIKSEKEYDSGNSFEIINFSDKKISTESLVVSYLKDLLRLNKKINHNDIAILTLYNYQCEELKTLFLKYNLQCNIINRKNIFDTESGELLRIFIKCLISPSSIRNIKLLSTTKFIQMHFDDLKDDNSTALNDIFVKLKNWSNELKEKGFITLVNEIIVEYLSPSIIYDKDLKNNLFQLSEILEKELIKENYNLNKILEWLTKELDINHRKNTGDNYLVRNYETSDGINISTIHSSKGLEFDLVICPYLWDENKDKKDLKGPIWKNQHTNKIYINIENSCKEVMEINNLEKEDIKNESERLIYVALTRAKNKLVIFNNIEIHSNKINNNIMSNLTDIKKYTTEIDSENNSFKIEDIKNNADQNYINLSPWQMPNIKITKKGLGNKFNKKIMFRSSYSAWIRKNERIYLKDTENDYEEKLSLIKQTNHNLYPIRDKEFYEKPTILSEFPKGTNAGKCLHKIIERFNFQDNNTNSLQKIIKEELQKHDIDSSNIDIVKDVLLTIVNIPLGIKFNNKRLIDIPDSNIIKEMKYEIPISFSGRIIKSEDISKCFLLDNNYDFSNEYASKIMDLDIYSKGFHSGFIDCIFSDGSNLEDGKWWIIDWKSNYISEEKNNLCTPINYTHNNLKEEMIKHHYPLQSHLYLLALHRLLKWRLKNYNPSIHLGGFIYFFIRGLPNKESIKSFKKEKNIPGLYLCDAPINRIKYLDNLFN